MIETTALGLLTIFTFYYIYFITRIQRGLLSLQQAPAAVNQPFVSVIVAARDEEKSIGPCLQSLVQQTYPANKYEIIVVNDGSTDATASIVQSFSERYSNVHLFSTPAGVDRDAGRKPLALAQGIGHSMGEIILTTDADCIAAPRWIQSMINHFEENVVFVAGPVSEQASANFFSKLERLEFLGLITTAAGLIGSGRPIICNGANLAYRRSAFISVGGFGTAGSFNDDESLMNRMIQRNIGKITFAPELGAVITTRSSNTLVSFLRQRIRWANKRGRYEDPTILITLVSLYLFFLNFALTVLLIPFNQHLLLPVVLVFGVKVFVDYFGPVLWCKIILSAHSNFPFSHCRAFTRSVYCDCRSNRTNQLAEVERADNKTMRWNNQMLKKKLFPSALFNLEDEYVYLTFDDGPHPVATPIVLQELKKHNIRATFFLLGQNAQKFPDLVRQIQSEGHQIANHSFTHTNLFFKNRTFIRDEILRTKETIESIIGLHSHYFRPPYGYLNRTISDVLMELGLTCVLWDVDSKDYRLKSVMDISSRVIPNTKNGSILLFHDNELTLGRGQTYLPVIFTILRRREFVFQALTI